MAQILFPMVRPGDCDSGGVAAFGQRGGYRRSSSEDRRAGEWPRENGQEALERAWAEAPRDGFGRGGLDRGIWWVKCGRCSSALGWRRDERDGTSGPTAESAAAA